MTTNDKVLVPREVLELHQFMTSAFSPFTPQQEQIAISLKKAKEAMLAAAPQPAKNRNIVKRELSSATAYSESPMVTNKEWGVTVQPAEDGLPERIAQIAAHRVCCNEEHDPTNGKLAGFCVVCGVPWPCEYAGFPPNAQQRGAARPSSWMRRPSNLA